MDRKKRIRIAAALLLLLALALGAQYVWRTYYHVPRGALQLHFLDVGEADCALVLCDGASMLIDAGEAGDGARIVSYLRAHGVERLDVLVATHPHADHIGGMAYVLERIDVGRCYLSPRENVSESYARLIAALENKGVERRVPAARESFALGGAAVTFVGDGVGFDTVNDSSLVLRVSYRGDSSLFTGDIEWPAETELVFGDAARLLDADVLKVPHHGSDTSSSEIFLEAVTPDIAVISVGANNGYGHPDAAVLARLAGCTVYRTDRQGDIVLDSDGAGFRRIEEDKLTPRWLILNKASGVFHRPGCEHLPRWSNRRLIFGHYRALALGYKPCGYCDP